MSKKYTLENILTKRDRDYVKGEILDVHRRSSAEMGLLIVSQSSKWYRIFWKSADVQNRTQREFELWRKGAKSKNYIFVVISLAEKSFEICLSKDIKAKFNNSKSREHAKENFSYGLQSRNPSSGITMAISVINDFLRKELPRRPLEKDFEYEPKNVLMFKE